MRSLTPVQSSTLAKFTSLAEELGIYPTRRQLAHAMGRSVATVHQCLTRLVAKGFLVSSGSNKHRNLSIPDICPSCGRPR